MTTLNSISEAGIANMALSRMGSSQTITSFQDASNEAAQAAFWYPQDRDAMLSDFPWPWAEGYAQLAQVAGPEINQQVASAQWARSYRYPPNCLKLRRLLATPLQQATTPPQTTSVVQLYPSANQPWLRPEGDSYPISFGLSSDATGRLIMSDFYGNGAGLTAIYTQAVGDPTQFAPDFADALAWRLAGDLAMALARDDSKRKFCWEAYEKTIRKARASEFNGTMNDVPWLNRQAGVIRARWVR